jgi:hypothetical protein
MRMNVNMFDGPPWSEMRMQVSSAAQSMTGDRPPFELKLDWPTSYQDLLAGVQVKRTQEDVLPTRTLETGRVVLSAEAGSGKTWLLARSIERTLAQPNAIPILIQLKNLFASSPMSNSDPPERVIRNLLSIAVPDPRFALTTTGDVPKLLLMVDGLNEVPRNVAELVISAVDELARRYPFLSVLITDRLVRRPIDLDRWRLATVLPLSDDEVRRAWSNAHEAKPLPEGLGLLKRPFFLDKALATDITADSEAGTIGAYFAISIGMSSADLDDLAQTAFTAYSEYRGRTMPAPWLRNRVPTWLLERLIQTDTVRINLDQAWFTHHLLHDYLAARSLASRKAEWGPGSFDIITLMAASFDSLRLTVEQLSDVADSDLLIRRIYDWNYYGAAYSLVPGYVSSETSVVILAMLADKRWDPIWATVVQVDDALRFDGSETARQLLEADGRDELFNIVRRFDSGQDWFRQWAELFTTPDGTTANQAMIAGLRTEDSIISWTLANVLRRCHIDTSAMNELFNVASDDSAVVRWRAMHVLGAHPSGRSAQLLRARLEDGDRWVRYGAVRSIIEIASRDPELRDEVFSMLIELVQSAKLDDSMLRELGRALDIRPQPEGWAYVIAPLVQQLIGFSGTLAEQDGWIRVMESIIYASGSPAR